MSNKIAATYRRVSLDEQTSNYSLPSQDRAMAKLAKEKGYTTKPELDFLDDGYLGGEFDRPALTRLRAAVRAGLVDTVIVYDVDRLARKLVHQLLLLEEFEKHGVKLETVNAPMEHNPEGKAMMSLRGVFAELEKTKFAERSARGRKEKALQGHIVGGRIAYGYRYEGKAQGKRGELVIVPEQAVVVRRIFQWAADGMGLLGICRRLGEEGIRPSKTKDWAKQVISQMLANTTYYGEARYNRRVAIEPEGDRRKPAPAGKSKKTSAKLRPETDWIIVPTPPIIDRALFDQVREQMASNKRMNSGRPAAFMLRGLLKCGMCGFACTVFHPGSGKARYRCNNIDRLTYKRKCPQPSVKVDALEAVIWKAVLDYDTDPRALYREHEEEQAKVQAAPETEKQRAELFRAIEKLKTKEFRATQAMLDPELTDAYETFRTALRDCQKQRRTLEAQLAAIQPAPKARKAFSLARSTENKLSALMSAEEKREAIRKRIERIELLNSDVTIYFKPDDDGNQGGKPATYCLKSEQIQDNIMSGFSIRRKVA
jgi:site-specific DNA recombinase